MERLSDYDYDLPPEAIAQRPLEDRSASKLLWLPRQAGPVRHLEFAEVLDVLQGGDLLVVNDTRVTALRVFGRKPTGAEVELLLLREEQPGLYRAMARPGRRLRTGAQVELEGGLRATIQGEVGAERLVQLEPQENLKATLARIGEVPLPPYIHERIASPERYQTVYASRDGSAAAPTAGLHFTPEILEGLRRKGVQIATVTLDVGLDTFRPVESEDLSQHTMHGERCGVPPETVAAVESCRGRIIAVGTTTVRTLESFSSGIRQLRSGEMETRLFIRPGYEFKVVDGMFTNFHLPRTTMLMMISAMASRDRVLDAYSEALQCGYRFLSFGDSMLIL